MSYILDALKKVEDEKARKNRVAAGSDIAGELFSTRANYGRGGGRKGVKITAAVAILLLSAVAAWLYTGKKEVAKKSDPPLQVVETQKPTPSPAQVIHNTPPPPASTPTPSPTPAPLPRNPEPASSGTITQKNRHKDQVLKKNPIKTVVQQPPKIAAPPDIQVSGVAWNDDKRLRRAVINGSLMKEGGQLSGATIKEIMPDKVRFEKNGGIFEVSFVSSTASAGVK